MNLRTCFVTLFSRLDDEEHVLHYQWAMQENNLGVGRGKPTKPNVSRANEIQLGGSGEGGGAVSCPSVGVLGHRPPYKNHLAF